MAAYREGKPRTSAAWEHFKIKDDEKSLATCNLCHEIFSYRTSVSNLMKHLRTKHSFGLVKVEDEDLTDAETDDGVEKNISTDKRKALKSEVWEYFVVKDEENKLATCTLCSQQFSYRTTSTNLTRHLKRKHYIDFGKDDDGSEGDDDVEKEISPPNLSRNRFKSSSAWQYFEDTDPERRVATCNICGAQCSYRTSVSNLMKHARRKHAAGDQDLSDADDLQMGSIRQGRSIVWSYFKSVDHEARIAKCQICSKLISHASTLTNLKKHLARKHPNVNISRKRILLSSGGELYEVETSSKQDSDDNQDNEQIQNDMMEMDTVYLEDFDALEQEPTPKKPKTNRQNKLVPRTTYDTSSDEEFTFERPKNDSLDHFGKYIASLLRGLPKKLSNQLQSDFIKQIMEAQHTCEAQKSPTDTQSNAYNATDTKSNKYDVTDTISHTSNVTDTQNNEYSITVTAENDLTEVFKK